MLLDFNFKTLFTWTYTWLFLINNRHLSTCTFHMFPNNCRLNFSQHLKFCRNPVKICTFNDLKNHYHHTKCHPYIHCNLIIKYLQRTYYKHFLPVHPHMNEHCISIQTIIVENTTEACNTPTVSHTRYTLRATRGLRDVRFGPDNALCLYMP